MKRLGVLAAVTYLLAACGQAGSAGKITVTMDEWSIKLSETSAPAGDVSFVLKNNGKVTHELAILKTDLAPDRLAYRANDPSKAEEPGNVGEIEDVAPGASKEGTFKLTPGKYVLVCNEPEHYKAGMRIALVVK